MRKIDLILENIRDEYMINLLEEGSVSELETLKTKKFLNENLNRIRKMLIEEGALDSVKGHLANNWGKYLAGAGALGAGAAGAMTDAGQETLANLKDSAVDAYHQVPAAYAQEDIVTTPEVEGGIQGAARQLGKSFEGALDPAKEAINSALTPEAGDFMVSDNYTPEQLAYLKANMNPEQLKAIMASKES